MFFRNRIFGNKSLQRMRQLMIEHLGEDKGQEICSSMATLVLADMKRTGMTMGSLMKSYRKVGLTHDEAAISVIDGAVGSMKRVAQTMVAARQSGRKVDDDQQAMLAELVRCCEKVLDGWAKPGKSRIVPRNGRFGEAATANFGEFLTR